MATITIEGTILAVTVPDISEEVPTCSIAATTSNAPPVISSSAPPVTTSNAPPVVISNAPPVISSSAPPVITSSAPPVIESNVPPVVASSTPPVITSSVPLIITYSVPSVITCNIPSLVTSNAPPIITSCISPATNSRTSVAVTANFTATTSNTAGSATISSAPVAIDTSSISPNINYYTAADDISLEDAQQALDILNEYDNLDTWIDYNPEQVGNKSSLEDSLVTYSQKTIPTNESNNITGKLQVASKYSNYINYHSNL